MVAHIIDSSQHKVEFLYSIIQLIDFLYNSGYAFPFLEIKDSNIGCSIAAIKIFSECLMYKNREHCSLLHIDGIINLYFVGLLQSLRYSPLRHDRQVYVQHDVLTNTHDDASLTRLGVNAKAVNKVYESSLIDPKRHWN